MSAAPVLRLLLAATLLATPGVAVAGATDEAQASPGARTAPVRLVVYDQTGLIIIGATVKVIGADGVPREAVTDDRGEARLDVPQGDYTIEVSSAGFESARYENQRVRGSGWRRDVILEIADFLEEVEVTRDPREAATDPRGNGFSTTLSQNQIDALPDDPDEMEEALRQMAGPGATFRVNGFRNSGLPPKSQIREIRFRQNAYAADSHEASHFSVDIVTQPGKSNWRTSMSFGFRDDALDARNAFASREVDEQQRRGSFSIDGPLWKDRTSVELNVDGFDAFEVRPIVATTPQGQYLDQVRRPTERTNVRAGVDHALSKTQTLRVEFNRRDVTNDALGIGDLDLPERAYSRTNEETRWAARVRGPLGKRIVSDAYGEFVWRDVTTSPDSLLPAVRVQGAFNAGGAQTQGGRDQLEYEFGHNLDFLAGKHTIRGGYLLERGSYTSDELRNSGGTFTFASLADYEAAYPTTYTQRIGDPLVSYGQTRAAWYLQDDYRVRKDLTLSFGVRHEWQQHVDSVWNFAPRGGFVWSPFRSGKTTFRGGAGIFFDWMDANVYEETLQVDGRRVQDLVIYNPSYPDPLTGAAAVVQPSGRVQLADHLDMPTLRQASFGIEHAFGPALRVNATYRFRDGENLLRGRNVNAPREDGTRPEPGVGTVTEVQSIGESRSHQLVVGFNRAGPNMRLMFGGNYTLSFSRDDGSGALALPANSITPDEWGPAGDDVRHRLGMFFNMRLLPSLRLGGNLRAESASPYNITTGRDDNRDTVFNDRPSGVARNSARGDDYVDLNLRLGYTFGFGTRKTTGGAGPGGGPMVVRVGGGDRGGPMGGGPMDRSKLVSFEVYASASNVLNTVNYSGYSGVVTSPYFGIATSARPPRRIEIGMRVMF